MYIPHVQEFYSKRSRYMNFMRAFGEMYDLPSFGGRDIAPCALEFKPPFQDVALAGAV
jgi:hypothetical protein